MADDDQQRILITQATPGMVLAQSVYTQNRVPLCGPGTTLSDGLIHRLIMRGVKRVHVQGHPLPARSQLPFDEQAAQCRERFTRCENTAMMLALRECIIEQIARTS